jgi:large subunit ribosomal protein L10
MVFWSGSRVVSIAWRDYESLPVDCGKDFFYEGGEIKLAISRKRKDELIEQYTDWLERSQAMLMANYAGQPTQSIYKLRTKVRAAQGEFHVVKNTLLIHAMNQMGLPLPEAGLEGPTAVTFCFQDPPPIAKVLLQFEKEDETKAFSVKGALLGRELVDAEGVKMLSELPPYPVVMAQVLGTIQAPGGRIAGTVNAVLQQIASVVKARVDQLQAQEGAA